MNLHFNKVLTGCVIIMVGLLASVVFAQSEIELLPPLEQTGSPANAAAPSAPLNAGSDAIFTNEGVPTELEKNWFSREIWDYGLELGINGSEGNAESLSVIASGNMKRETDAYTISFDATYGKTEANGVQTQHYGLMNSRFDWKMTDRWFLFNKTALEYDEFKAFDLRLAITGGLGRHFIKNDSTKFTGRFGAGVSREFGGPDDEWKPEANFGIDFERKLTQRQKVALSSDYYPTWEDFTDYRLVSTVSWQYLLDKETNLSLKVGATDRYDSTPNGAKHNDLDYYLALLWKL